MKIATWNVNSIRTRLDQVIDWLRENPVQVLCLQETKVVDADFPRSPFIELGYHVYCCGQKAYNGVALISQLPLSEVSSGFLPVLGEDADQALFDQQKRVITGVTADGLRVVNLYVPNGSAVGSEKYAYKLRWLQMLKGYLQTLLEASPDLLVCGDINIALEDQDIHENFAPGDRQRHIMASEPERDTLKTLLELGLADAFRKFTPEGGHFSWWDYRAGSFRQNKGWRIDHHYLTPRLYQRAIACKIDSAPRKLPKPSDHVPVIVELEAFR